jgi:hypothetical protein
MPADGDHKRALTNAETEARLMVYARVPRRLTFTAGEASFYTEKCFRLPAAMFAVP